MMISKTIKFNVDRVAALNSQLTSPYVNFKHVDLSDILTSSFYMIQLIYYRDLNIDYFYD